MSKFSQIFYSVLLLICYFKLSVSLEIMFQDKKERLIRLGIFHGVILNARQFRVQPEAINILKKLTANYTKWWLLQWSIEIFPHRPFWQNIIFHYFDFIFSIANIHLWIFTLNLVIPSSQIHMPFNFLFQHFSISGFLLSLSFPSKFLHFSLRISCLAHVYKDRRWKFNKP